MERNSSGGGRTHLTIRRRKVNNLLNINWTEKNVNVIAKVGNAIHIIGWIFVFVLVENKILEQHKTRRKTVEK